MHNFRKLEVWQEAMLLVKTLYHYTENLPPEEKFGLKSQLRRAAISVPSNIAEGCGSSHHKQFLRYLEVANGSLYEIETQCILSERLGYLNPNELDSLLPQIHRLQKRMYQFIKSIRSRQISVEPQ